MEGWEKCTFNNIRISLWTLKKGSVSHGKEIYRIKKGSELNEWYFFIILHNFNKYSLSVMNLSRINRKNSIIECNYVIFSQLLCLHELYFLLNPLHEHTEEHYHVNFSPSYAHKDLSFCFLYSVFYSTHESIFVVWRAWGSIILPDTIFISAEFSFNLVILLFSKNIHKLLERITI